MTALVTLVCFPLFARSDSGRLISEIQTMDGIVTEMNGRYKLHVIEPFEDRLYSSRAASVDLDIIQYRFSQPEPEEAYLREQDAVRKHAPDAVLGNRTLQVQSAFSVPGRQVYFFKPDREIEIPGQPLRGSLWVKSNGYMHRLVMLLRNANGKPVSIDLGTLSYKGWRRLSFDFPQSVYEPGSSIENRYGAKLTGFKILSSKHDQSYSFSIQMDQFLVISDYTQQQYPGAEIEDNWPR